MSKLIYSTHADLAICKTATVMRDEYLDYMTFAANTRPLFTEIFGPIIGLKEEWLAQGASEAELNFSAFRYRCPALAHVPVCTGRFGGPVVAETISETDTEIFSRDNLGRILQLIKGAASIPLPIAQWPVRNMDDWLKLKPYYQYSPARLAPDWLAKARQQQAAGCAIVATIPGGFDEPRQLMGEENLCIAYYEQPELIHDMLQTMAETAVRVLDKVTAEITVDILSVHEDMAGKSGPLAGPRQIQEFIHPYYRRVWEMVAGRGARLFDQDSDGDMRPVLDAFIAAGINCMHPMEPAAGMDMVTIRQKYGTRLAVYGGIDKHVLRQSREAITAELEYKLPPMIASGGCMLGLDHRIPNGTPLENYRFYIDKAWEIIQRCCPDTHD